MHNTKTHKVPPKTASVVEKAPHSCDILMNPVHQTHLKKRTVLKKYRIHSLVGQATASEHVSSIKITHTQGSCSAHIMA